MSAYILDSDNIDLLVTAALRGIGSEGSLRVYHEGEWHEWNRYENADELGQLLVDANVASVNFRYNEDTPAYDYTYNGAGIIDYIGSPAAPWGVVLAALDCYEYQSCEAYETWPTSLAKAAVDVIRRKVCRKVSNECDARWDWSRADMAKRLEALTEKARA